MIFVVIQLLVLCVWILIFWAIIRYLFVLKAKDSKSKMVRIGIGIVLLAVWIGWPFWEISGRKMYYDAQVDKMCAKDGGVKIYETVTLSPERFESYKKRNWILPDKAYVQPEDEYYVVREKHYYKRENPQVIRLQTQIIRSSDGVVLGEYIHYGRGGGDLPGPWHGSSFSCPNPTTVKFETNIFSKGD